MASCQGHDLITERDQDTVAAHQEQAYALLHQPRKGRFDLALLEGDPRGLRHAEAMIPPSRQYPGYLIVIVVAKGLWSWLSTKKDATP